MNPLAVGSIRCLADTIVLSFEAGCHSSFAMDPVSAADPSNYSVDRFVRVQSAELACDRTHVVLTTTPQDERTTYIVTVNNVRDQDGISVPADSTATFNTAARLAVAPLLGVHVAPELLAVFVGPAPNTPLVVRRFTGRRTARAGGTQS